MRTLFILLISALTVHSQKAAAQGGKDKLSVTTITSFSVKKIVDSNSISYHIPKPDKPYLLFIYLSPDCPFSKNYTLILDKLFQQYGDSVQFYGCVAGSSYRSQEISSFIHTYKVLFPVVVDEKKQLAAYLKATVTPEVILLNKAGKRLYKGAIDDWVQGWGKPKLIVSKHYLENAITASREHKEIIIKNTTAYGCMIRDY